ncbi:MAG: hypothetical protein ACOX9R_05570 [Armatimonadota bacterium]
MALFETAEAGQEGAERAERTLPITAGSLEDSFGGLGMHIYRIELP